MIRKTLLIIITLFCLQFVVFDSVSAQEQIDATSPTPTPLAPQDLPETGIDLTVSPVFINLRTDPGKPVSAQIKIKNNSNIEEFLTTHLLKFETSPDGARPLLVELDKDDPFISWVTFSKESFTLAPNETTTVKVTITPPKDAALGYYYGVAFERIAEKETGATGTTITGAPAVSLLLEVRSPNAKKELQLVDFTTDQLFYEYLPATFTITMKNTGNIHIIPAGDIFIDWGGQKDIGILQTNEARGNVLPKSQRTFSVVWDDGMIVRIPKVDEKGKEITDKDGNTVYETKIDFDKPLRTFRIGKYTANLLMVYDNGERDVPLEAQVSFWIVPWKILLISFAIGLFALIGIRATLSSSLRNLRQKKNK